MMKEVKSVKITPDNKQEIQNVMIPTEFCVNIFINNIFWKTMVCTQEYIEEFVIGHLFCEGVIHEVSQVENITSSSTEEDVFVTVDHESFCRVKTKQFLPLSVLPHVEYRQEWIFHMANAFVKGGTIHQKTKATHSCILSRKGKILFACEDIGRHCAMDKAIGYLHKNKISANDCILFTTGRIPTEMARKAIYAGVPILVSKAVPTDKALFLAHEYGLQLICKAWPDSFEVFN